MKPQRREFLCALAAGATALSLPRAAFSQTGVTATKLTYTTTLISGAGNNIVALKSDTGSLLVDCGDAAGHALACLRAGVKLISMDPPNEKVADIARQMGAELVRRPT